MRNRTVALATAFALSAFAGACSTGAGARDHATAPTHIETWAYDDSASGWCNGGYGAGPSVVRRWLTYAETNCGPRAHKALRDCHAGRTNYCTVLIYLDPNLVWPGNPIPQNVHTTESWWLHQPGYKDSAHRLTETSSYGRGYLLDQAIPAVQQRVQSYLRANFDPWDGVMVDDTSGSLTSQLWGTRYQSSDEIATDSALLAAHRHLAAALTHSNGGPFVQVDNGISANPYVRPTFPLLEHPTSVIGLVAENEPWAYGMQPYYPTLLDEMAYVDRLPNGFIALLSYDRDGSRAARRVQEATVLLGYSPSHVVDWEDLEQGNLHLAVWPEEGIYPTRPLQSMGVPEGPGCLAGTGAVCSFGGHNQLRVADGVYRREFRLCYDRGVPFGHCAVIVNDTAHTVKVRPSWLQLSYSHRITLRGGDVQSGGMIDTKDDSFIPGSTAIAPNDALLLAQ